jgi:hypothetical protein
MYALAGRVYKVSDERFVDLLPLGSRSWIEAEFRYSKVDFG